jgi:hypothetical protein
LFSVFKQKVLTATSVSSQHKVTLHFLLILNGSKINCNPLSHSIFHLLNSVSSLGFVVPSIFNHSNKTPNQMQQSIAKFYCFVVQTLLNMFRALQCPSSGARQTAVAASGFRMNVQVEVFSAAAENTSTSTFIRKPEAATAV